MCGSERKGKLNKNVKARYFLGAAGSSMIQGQTARISFTLPLLFLMTVIFMSGSPAPYRKLSTTTSTSQGRSVPFFFGLVVFLFFIALLLLKSDLG